MFFAVMVGVCIGTLGTLGAIALGVILIANWIGRIL